MAAMFRDTVAIVNVAVVRMRPQAIPLAMISIRKSIYGFPLIPYIVMGLRFWGLRAAGAPLLHRHSYKLFSKFLAQDNDFPAF